MTTINRGIDPYLFEQQFVAFRAFVEEESGVGFASFSANPYTEQEEGYKYKIYAVARKALNFADWSMSDIGSGTILAAAISAIELPENNLVPWQRRYGDKARPHHPLYVAQGDAKQVAVVERSLFKLYREQSDSQSFEELIGIFGRTYPLLAYLLFIKDHSKFLPIAPKYFDRAFGYLGADIKTSGRCSWENYNAFLDLIRQVKSLLAEALSTEVSLLDAHSFTWMLAAQMEEKGKLPDTESYLKLPAVEREAIVKARIGQGRFRQSLLDYWGQCAVTGCGEKTLLVASHIKPWSKATIQEKLSRENGLLLSPSLDLCFDSGLISFLDDGQIIISASFNIKDAQAVGVHAGMCLSKVEDGHKPYLAYHREHIFENSKCRKTYHRAILDQGVTFE